MFKLHDVVIDDEWKKLQCQTISSFTEVGWSSPLIWFRKRRTPLMRAFSSEVFCPEKYFCAQWTQLLRGDTNQVKIVSDFAPIKTKNMHNFYFLNILQYKFISKIICRLDAIGAGHIVVEIRALSLSTPPLSTFHTFLMQQNVHFHTFQPWRVPGETIQKPFH